MLGRDHALLGAAGFLGLAPLLWFRSSRTAGTQTKLLPSGPGAVWCSGASDAVASRSTAMRS